MSFGIDKTKLKRLVELYTPYNQAQEIKYLHYLKGEEDLLMNLETNPFQGISQNSVEERMAFFGQNSLSIERLGLMKMVAYAVKPLPIKMMLLLSLITFIASMVFDYNELSIPQLEPAAMMVINAINIAILMWMGYGKFSIYNKFASFANTNHTVNVIRENKQRTIPTTNLVVGDLVELLPHATVHADGWLIQGDLLVQEKYSHQSTTIEKATAKNCVLDLQRSAEIKGTEKGIVSLKSPVILSGTTIKEGEGRMIVLCVGKLSKRGQFEYLVSRQSDDGAIIEKIQKLLFKIVKYGMTICLMYLFLVSLEFVLERVFRSDWSQANYYELVKLLVVGTCSMMILLPQGLLIGLGMSLLYQQVIIWTDEKVRVKSGISCASLATISYLCYDKRRNVVKVNKYKQWWNETSELFQQDAFSGNTLLTESELHPDNHISSIFMNLMKSTFYLNQSQLPTETYAINQHSVMLPYQPTNISILQQQLISIFQEQINLNITPKSVRTSQNNHHTTILQEQARNQHTNNPNITHCDAHSSKLMYICNEGIIKNVISTLTYDQNQILIVKGQSDEILKLSTHMISKSNGKVQLISAERREEMKEVIKFMNRRMVKSCALAYKMRPDTHIDSIQSRITELEEGEFIFMYILTLCSTKDNTEYEIVKLLEDIGISIIFTTHQPLPEAIHRATDVGINVADHQVLALKGKDFVQIIGGLICSSCQKYVCICQNVKDNNLKVKNLDDFNRMLRHLKVIGEASYLDKYALAVGLKNANKNSAIFAHNVDDIPAMQRGSISLISNEQWKESLQDQNNCQLHENLKEMVTIELPCNSLRLMYKVLNWSRFNYILIQKYLQLVMTSSIVGFAMVMVCLIVMRQYVIKMVQVMFVNVILLPLLGFNLSIDKYDGVTYMSMHQKQFDKNSSMLSSLNTRHITAQAIFQILVLLIVLFTGHLYIPQSEDQVDSLIGLDWQLKYSDQTKTTISSGLYYNLFATVSNYQLMFHKYAIFSRHFTLLYNLFVFMQLFNYFNCRKASDTQINIFKNITIPNILIFLFVLVLQFLFIEFAGSGWGFYPNGLTLKQWAFCFGVAMIVWVLGFVMKAMPESDMKIHKQKVTWTNRSYNLSVKSVNNGSSGLIDFQMDQDFHLKWK